MGADNRALIDAYAEASVAFDSDRLARLRHPDWTEEWPQSGERIPNHDAYRRIHERYPGGFPDITVKRVVAARIAGW